MQNNFIFMKASDTKELREKILKENNNICPIMNIEIDKDSAVLDHIHASEATGLGGEESYGCIRGTIHSYVNIVLGKIENSVVRTGLSNYIKKLNSEGVDISLAQILRNMADYLESGAYISEGFKYVHHTEVPKPKRFTKTCYGKLVKELKKQGYKNKIPEYPKSGLLSKPLKELFEVYKVEVEYYK